VAEVGEVAGCRVSQSLNPTDVLALIHVLAGSSHTRRARPLPRAANNGRADGQGDGSWHSQPRRQSRGYPYPNPTPDARLNLYVGINGKTYCRVTAARGTHNRATPSRAN
jgi:hypothetical protein